MTFEDMPSLIITKPVKLGTNPSDRQRIKTEEGTRKFYPLLFYLRSSFHYHHHRIILTTTFLMQLFQLDKSVLSLFSSKPRNDLIAVTIWANSPSGRNRFKVVIVKPFKSSLKAVVFRFLTVPSFIIESIIYYSLLMQICNKTENENISFPLNNSSG